MSENLESRDITTLEQTGIYFITTDNASVPVSRGSIILSRRSTYKTFVCIGTDNNLYIKVIWGTYETNWSKITSSAL